MTVDERLENIARTLDTLIKIHLDNDREYRERFRELAEVQAENDQRFAAATRNFEAVTRNFEAVTRNFEIVLDSIKRLEVIATSHDQRLDDLEGQ